MLLPHSTQETVPNKECGKVYRIETGIFTSSSSHGLELSKITKWDSKDPLTNTGKKIERAVTDYVYLGSTKNLVRILLLY